MDDETKQLTVKKEENVSFQETDSFDEPKGVPISMEPVFSTAAGVRIDVKPESIDKSRKLLNNDSSSKTSFSSPLLKPKNNGSTPFISPFRKDQPSTSSASKRPASETRDAPPSKKPTEKAKSSRKESREIHTDVLRIAKIHEKDQYRMVLQESSSAPLIMATCSVRRGRDIKFGDRLHLDVEVLKEDEKGKITDVYIEKVIKNKNNGAKSGIQRHPVSDKPFCLKPKFIYELSKDVKTAVLQVNIYDLKFEIYEGCNQCFHVYEKSRSSRKSCGSCKSHKAVIQEIVFAKMRVSDFSGQIFINVASKQMEKFLDLLGYKNVDQWHQFKDPNERQSYVFRPVMVEIEKLKDEWECVDIVEVNWKDYGAYLIEKEKKY